MLILVDQDGVLADFEVAFLGEYQRRHPELPYVPVEERTTFYVKEQYPAEHLPYVHAIHGTEGFYRSLPPIEGAVEAMEEMLAAGHDVNICTAPLTSNLYCASEKHAWIAEHLGKAWLKRTIIAPDKTLVRGDILIDDRPEVRGRMQPTWEHVVFGAPYNQDTTRRRLAHWKDWQELIGAAQQ